MTRLIAVTGATGALGGRVARRLAAAAEDAGARLRLWVTSYLAIRDGELATVSDVVREVAGHPALTVAEHLRRHPEDWAHLTR